MKSKKNPYCIWITGMPSSGKSTISRRLKNKIPTHLKVAIFESDVFRKEINLPAPYSTESRHDFYKIFTDYIFKISDLLNLDVVIIDATGNYLKFRNRAKSFYKLYKELYVYASALIRISRDPKGLYNACKNGQKPNLPIYPLGDTISPINILHEKDRVYVMNNFLDYGVYEVNPEPDYIVMSGIEQDTEITIKKIINEIEAIISIQ